MGWRASTNAEVFIDDVFVPDDDVIGEVGTGFAGAVRTFELSRIEVAACSIGVAARRARIRPRLCQPTRSVRTIHRPVPGCQLPVGRRGHTPARFASVDVGCGASPIAASRSARRHRWPSCSRPRPRSATTSQAMQVLGGHGYVEDHPVEKWFRDARLETIEEGTSEIQRVIIGRGLLDSSTSLF